MGRFKFLMTIFLTIILMIPWMTAQGQPKAKILVLVDGNDPNSIDPPIGTGPPGHIQYAIYDPLVDHNEKMEPRPGLAESWEVSVDKLIWTFRLRKGVKFHDGTDFNSEAVKFTIERIQDPKFGALRRSVYLIVTKIETPDPFTVKMTTKTPFADLPFLFMDRSSFIVSPAAVKKLGNADFGLKPVGTGPFKFVEWLPNDRIVMEANKNYWKGAPKIERLIYRPVPESAARSAMLRTGEADIVMNLSAEDLASLRKDPNITIIQKDSLSQVTSEMRQTKPPFNDKRVRQAMNYAVDKKAIVEHVMRGLGRIADSPGPPGVWGSVELKPFEYNPAKARQLLTEAGYPRGFEGNLFYVPGRWSGDTQVTEALQGYWADIGIKIKLHKVDQAGLVEMLKRHPDEMIGWTTQQIRTSTYLDYHLYRLFNCEAAIMVSAQRSGYCNKKVDELLDKGRSTFDLEKRNKYYEDAQRLIWEDAPFIWVFVMQNAMGVRKGVAGLEPLPINDVRLQNVTKQ